MVNQRAIYNNSYTLTARIVQSWNSMLLLVFVCHLKMAQKSASAQTESFIHNIFSASYSEKRKFLQGDSYLISVAACVGSPNNRWGLSFAV